jgi:hypothetical protein
MLHLIEDAQKAFIWIMVYFVTWTIIAQIITYLDQSRHDNNNVDDQTPSS